MYVKFQLENVSAFVCRCTVYRTANGYVGKWE